MKKKDAVRQFKKKENQTMDGKPTDTKNLTTSM